MSAVIEPTAGTLSSAAELRRLLLPYARPDHLRAWWQLANTLVPFLALWVLMALTVLPSRGWSLLLAFPVAGLYMRLFIIQHDCGHGSFFSSTRLNRSVGALIGLLTMFPFGYWKKTHEIHHRTSGNLDRRGVGDISMMTVREYRSCTRMQRLAYRLYRSMPVMLGIGPMYQFVVKHRLPFDMPLHWRREWASVLLNDVAIVVVMIALCLAFGWQAVLAVQLSLMLIAGAAGVWLFYVQHQFEGAYWSGRDRWDAHPAAMRGSSFYDLPRLAHWFTGNIGYHHIHHLSTRIPNYRLRACFESSPLLQAAPRFGFFGSLRCARLKLWDEESQRMVPFHAAALLRPVRPLTAE